MSYVRRQRKPPTMSSVSLVILPASPEAAIARCRCDVGVSPTDSLQNRHARILSLPADIARSGMNVRQGGTQMRAFVLIVVALLFLALGSLEVIAAHNLAVSEELSARSAGYWK